MPLLQYRCTACNMAFEALVSLTGTQSPPCPDCGGEAARAYEGVCRFGMAGSSAGRGGGCSGDCGCCGGCASHHGTGGISSTGGASGSGYKG